MADGMVVLDIAANAAPFERSMNRLQSSVASIGRKMAGVLSVAAVASFGKQCVELASNLNEVQNVVDVTFKTMSAQVDEWAKNAASSFGLSQTMAKRYVGTFGSMAEAFGFTEKEAYDMSTALTGLAGDVASFYNISQDEAYTKLKSVFSGETETLKELGIVMTQNALDAYALANGYGKVTKDMSEQEKVALRLAFVQQQLSNATGDFSRTSQSWANQTRLLALNFDSLRATIGQSLIAALLPVVKVMNGIIEGATRIAQAFNSLVEQITGKSMAELTGGAQSTGAALVDLGNVSEDSASSATDLASAQADAAKAAANQNKAQKALNKTLAGFDKINKLQSKETKEATAASSGGSSTPAVGGGGGVSGAAGVGDVAKQAGLLSKIKLPPALEKAFTRLKTAISGVVGVIKGGLQWAYDNILKPLGKWTVNKLAPKVVKLLAAALEFLKSASEALAPVFKAVWEAVFKPLAKFAGKLVIGMIEGITGALEDLAAFAKKHPKAFAAIAIGLTALFGVRKAGLTFANVGFKIGKALGALAATKLGAKLAKVGTALRAVFAVIGRHPIIAIIAAVAAGIYAIYKNWDKIKDTKIGQSLSRLWDALKPLVDALVELGSTVLTAIVNGATKIFKTIKPYLDKIGPILEKVVEKIVDGLCAAIDWLAKVIKKATPIVKKIIDWIGDKLGKAVKAASKGLKAFRKIWQSIKSRAVKLIATAKEKIKGAIKKLKKGWESIKNRVADLKARVISKANEIKNRWNKVVSSVKGKIADMKARIATKWADLKERWHNLRAHITNKVADFKAKIATKWADLKERWHNLRAKITNKVADFKAKIATKWADIKERWNNLKSHIQNKTADFKARIATAWADLKWKWENLTSHFGDITANIGLTLSTTWESAKGFINNAITGLNNQLNGIYWPSWVPAIGGRRVLPWNPIPWLAQGGYVERNTPRLAVIGDNKREGEIVAPESKLQAMADKAAGGGMSTVEDLLRQLISAVNAQDRGVYLDGRDISRAVVRNVNRQTQATGRCPIVV